MKTRVETIRLGGLGVFADFFNDAKELATLYNCRVEFTFNGINVFVNKHSDYVNAYDMYNDQLRAGK